MNILGFPVPVISRYIGSVSSATNTTVHTVNSKARFAKARFYVKCASSTTIQAQAVIGGTVMAGSTTAQSPGGVNTGGMTAVSAAAANAFDKKFMGEYFAKPGDTIAFGMSGLDTGYYSIEVEEYF